MEVWLHAFAFPGRTAPLARRAEDLGLDGLLVADSQCLNADVWIELALATAATKRIALGPGVTNPLTRHASVTASAAATLQVESGGRAVLGIGRGDSAVTALGRRPVPARELERVVVMLQAYLRGEQVDVDGTATEIRWIAGDGVPKVPLAVAATGPRTIAAGARHAERLDLTVGAEPERLRWAIGVAREAAGERPLSIGAYLNVAVDADRAAARDLVRGSTAIFARFATEGAPPDGLSAATRAGIERLAGGYDPARHGHAAAPHARALDDAFIDRFAVAGPAGEVAERLRELSELGVERVIVVPGSLDADPARVQASIAALAHDVVPRL